MALEPSRIKLARQRAQLSEQDLAQILELEASTVHEIESRPCPDFLAKSLATALNCSPRYLHRSAAQHIDLERIFFRSPRRTSERTKLSAAAFAQAGVELFDQLAQLMSLPHTEVPDYSGLSPESAAARLRLDWSLGCGAIPDVLYLLEAHGVRVLSVPEAVSVIGSFSFWEDGQAFTFIAPQDGYMLRFDLMMELGHLLLHSYAGSEDSSRAVAHREARLFAQHLLLPALGMRVSNMLQVPQLIDLERHYEVPASEILDFALHLELLDTQHYQWLREEMAMESSTSAHPERSRIFSLIFDSFRGRYTENVAQGLVQSLALSMEDLHELTFGQCLLLIRGGGTQSESTSTGHLHAL